ncbi:hypothetical protein K435DRAFT_810230 [Dendrothele bispora CBS 962.96]|uniref:Uncharacterized protein n=1 Tax=Dendrothele bispora (strain CBS 962.96) TaxID=1314807 RepID=A0A4S8KVU9_DENBC|nr:hypothetical protein K435DRAFT_810230 [Dendrothele bispora CBS 962.96]
MFIRRTPELEPVHTILGAPHRMRIEKFPCGTKLEALPAVIAERWGPAMIRKRFEKHDVLDIFTCNGQAVFSFEGNQILAYHWCTENSHLTLGFELRLPSPFSFLGFGLEHAPANGEDVVPPFNEELARALEPEEAAADIHLYDVVDKEKGRFGVAEELNEIWRMVEEDMYPFAGSANYVPGTEDKELDDLFKLLTQGLTSTSRQSVQCVVPYECW